MFRIAKERIVPKVPVIINVPGEGGAMQKRKVHLNFKMVDRGALDKLIEGDDGTADNDWLNNVVTGWQADDVEAEGVNGEVVSLEFSKDNLVLLLGVPQARTAIYGKYMELMAGVEARRKN